VSTISCRKLLTAIVLLVVSVTTATARSRWTPEQANTWYASQPWPVGSNFIPADAINQLEMWQSATFNPQEIDKELTLAQGLGMTTMRVFLHDLLWDQDQAGFEKRLDQFLTIADKHHIHPILVLFDSCWDPFPELGPQRPPMPGIHNSGWMQSPGAHSLSNPSDYPRLERYTKGIITAFGKDPRILAWDLWNEPGSTSERDLKNKEQIVLKLLPQVFTWARSVDPQQPLTSGVWDEYADHDHLSDFSKVQLSESDIITFHNYSWPENFEAAIKELQRYHRPIICTEYMARPLGSTFDAILPLAKKYNVGAINWGFVAGKTQTYFPWDSWQHPYVNEPPPVWFHEIYKQDYTPYRPREVEIIRSLTGAATPTQTTGGGQ
jgi:hypothetical protein